MRNDLTHLSDEALVALVARGDETALGELYDRVGRIAYGIALRVLRDDRLAEDAVQEGFLAVWRSAATFRAERAKASTWIVTLVHRRAVDLVRREERRRTEPLDLEQRDAPDPAGSAEDEAWLGFERERVQRLLRSLPDAQREALELALYSFRYLDEVTMVAVALPAVEKEDGEAKQSRAVFYRPGDLLPQLQEPLAKTLSPTTPRPETLSKTESGKIDSLVLRNQFDSSIQPLDGRQRYLVLSEPEIVDGS